MTTRITSSYYYHHGHSAIAESRFAKESGVTVYSVGLSAGTSGQDILNRVASPGKSYEATNDDYRYFSGNSREAYPSQQLTLK